MGGWIRMKRFFRRRLGGRSVVIEPGSAMAPEEVLRAFAVSDNYPLWKATVQLLDDSIATRLTDAVDGERFGEQNAVERGEAKALIEFKTRLMEFKEAAKTDGSREGGGQ